MRPPPSSLSSSAKNLVRMTRWSSTLWHLGLPSPSYTTCLDANRLVIGRRGFDSKASILASCGWLRAADVQQAAAGRITKDRNGAWDCRTRTALLCDQLTCGS
jgi:hypothetical protein